MNAVGEDGLVAGPPEKGQVILNVGGAPCSADHSTNAILDDTALLFLRIVAYAAFAESVCVPARYALTNADVFEAMTLARPLLKAGVLRPERRAEIADCAGLAVCLAPSDDAAAARGEWLDAASASQRAFRSTRLSGAYRETLLDDLSRSGGLRRLLLERAKPSKRLAIERAHEAYAELIESPTPANGTPEAFREAVAQQLPAARALAHRWAMARYCVTPMRFDSVTVREVPGTAYDLLVRAGAGDRSLRPCETPPPVEGLHAQIATAVDSAFVKANATAMCQAVLAVRDRVPEARIRFADVARRKELPMLSGELRILMQEELRRQQGVRSVNEYLVSCIASVAGFGVGELVGDDVGVAIGTATASGLMTTVIQRQGAARRARRRQPWLVARAEMAGAVAAMRGVVA